MTTATNVVAMVTGTQMGVSILLEGMRDWPSYLELQVDNNEIDQDTADDWAQWYDGYMMKWTFENPAITASANGAIDAACIKDEVFAVGGVCVGLEYTGSVSYTADKWAIWVSVENFANFSANTGLVGEVDSEKWYVENNVTSFTDTFTFYRWLPVEEIDYRYYENEYRWYAGQHVQVYTYSSEDTTAWTLTEVSPTATEVAAGTAAQALNPSDATPITDSNGDPVYRWLLAGSIQGMVSGAVALSFGVAAMLM